MRFSVCGSINQAQFHCIGEFELGQRVALLGVSGAGKSTLLRCMAGLDRLMTSDVSFNGIAGQKAWQSPTTLLHQTPVMFAHHTVQQTLDYGEKYAKNDTALPRQRWLEQLGIEDVIHQSCTQLSGGQQQRVALLRALLNRSHWLLLDESFSAMDKTRVIDACDVIAEYCALTGAGLVLASHNDVPQRYLCNSSYVIDDGRGRYEKDGWNGLSRSNNPSTTTTLQVTVGYVENGFLKTTLTDQTLYVPIPKRWQPGLARVSLFAGDLSIALGDQHRTSMVNRLNARIDELSTIDHESVLVSLSVGSQRLITEISQWSCQRLGLAVQQSVFVEFKVGVVEWHGQVDSIVLP